LIALGITSAVVVVGVWLVLGHVLVNLTNSRQGQPFVPGTIAPGGFVTGEVGLANTGLLPISVNLETTSAAGSLPAQVSVKIEDLDAKQFLYVGPLQASMGPLLVLDEGRHARLRVTLVSENPQGTAALPLPLTYSWATTPAVPWWWWTPVALVALRLLYLGFRRPRTGAA